MMLPSDHLYGKAAQKGVPLGGAFELSPVCNFKCKMCYVRKSLSQIHEEGKSLIPRREWEQIAAECREAGTLYLLLTGGEPFLYPEFPQLYETLHRMGFLLSINTNGTLIDKETLQWLKKIAPTRINMTLYGASRASYGRICGQEEGYDRAMEALRLLTEAKIPVVINASMIPENGEDLEKILEIGKSYGLNTRLSTYMFPPVRRDREESDSRFTPETAAEMFLRKCKAQFTPEKLQEMFLKEQQREENGENWGSQEEHMQCRAGRSSFWLSWEGKMVACGLFPEPLETEPFREGFYPAWQRLTKAVRQMQVLEECRDCPRRRICNPCAATVHAECGDVNGKPDYLCKMAQCIYEEMCAYLKGVKP